MSCDLNALNAAYSQFGGLHYTRKFGFNTDIDAAFEPVWSAGGSMTYQTAAVAAEIISSDAADNGATATGALTVKVFGLDGNYVPVSETVTMDGTDAVALTNTYIFVYRAFVATAGSGKTNAGTITIRKTAGAVTMMQIPIGYSQTESTFFQVPAKCKAIVSDLSVSCDTVPNSSQISVKVQVFDPVGNVIKTKHTASFPDSSSPYEHYNVICTANEKEIIYVEAYSSVANFTISADYDIFVYGPMNTASLLDK